MKTPTKSMDQVWGRLRPWIRLDLVWWLLILTGVVLRLRQYLADRSFWSDEASLALNIVNRTFAGLTQPLDYEQGAPILFLFIEKAAITVLGSKDYILRLFPLIAGVAAVYVFYRISRAQLGGAGIWAILMFATSWPLIYYSSELKQYGSDVAVALLLVYLAGRCLREGAASKDLLALGITGTAAIWLSHTAVFFLAGIGLVLFARIVARKDSAHLVWIFGMGVAWIGSFGAVYLVSLRHLAADPFLQSYWHKAFVPMPPWSNPGWFTSTYYSLVFISLGRSDTILAVLVLALAILGGVSFLVRTQEMALIVILPFVMALLASALQKYPLKDRFVLFLAPFVILLAAEGVGRLYSIVARWKRPLGLVVCGLPALIIFGITAPTTFERVLSPYTGADIKPVLQYVAEHRQPDDTVYVFHGSAPAFDYYAPFYGLTSGNIVVGYDTTRKKLALESFYADLSGLEGRERVWFIFSDIVDCGGCSGDMQAYYVEYIDRHGRMLDEFDGAGANGYLYDMRAQ